MPTLHWARLRGGGRGSPGGGGDAPSSLQRGEPPANHRAPCLDLRLVIRLLIRGLGTVPLWGDGAQLRGSGWLSLCRACCDDGLVTRFGDLKQQTLTPSPVEVGVRGPGVSGAESPLKAPGEGVPLLSAPAAAGHADCSVAHACDTLVVPDLHVSPRAHVRAHTGPM